MALNSSGPLSFGGATVGQSINLELGVSATAQASINSTAFRTLAGVPSGAISLSNFYGKANFSERALFFGGTISGVRRTDIQYITITTTGNATAFGNLITAANLSSGCGSSTRGLSAGGFVTGSGTTAAIAYVTFASTGNATSFGNLTQTRCWLGATNSQTRGLFMGGQDGADNIAYEVIDYVTIATTGNAATFGNIGLGYGVYNTTGCSSSTRAIWWGGNDIGTTLSFIRYNTIATTGNSTSFGSLDNSRQGIGSCSSSTRGLYGGGFVGGVGSTTSIRYITIATTGNTLNFGSLSQAQGQGSPAASGTTRGVFNYAGTNPDSLNYVTIATTGNSTVFGSLVGTYTTPQNGAASSNANGGTQ